jgi:hypothetical protein
MFQLEAWLNDTNNGDIKSLNIKPNDVILFFDAWNPIFFYFSSFILVGMIGLEIVSVVLLYLILTTLRKKSSSFSAKTYRLHRQFTLLLISQLLCPIIFIGLPIAAGIITILGHVLPTKLAGEIGLITILVYGLSNSLLTITFIAPYQKHFLDSLSKIFRLNNSSPSTQVQPVASTIVIGLQKDK